MIGQRYFFVFFSLALVGCSHMDPHFWPERFKVPLQKGKVENVGAPAQITTHYVEREPSIARSEWKALPKQRDGQRDYLFTIRDRNGKLIVTDFAPEIRLEGDALLKEVLPRGPGMWLVRVDFPNEQAIVQVDFRLGEWRVENFKRVHWQLHKLDSTISHVHANKTRIRGDGKEELRVYVLLRDWQNFPVFQYHDYDLKLTVKGGEVELQGPFSTYSGPYFTLKTKSSTPLTFSASIEGEVVGKPFQVQVVSARKRWPASFASDCLRGLSAKTGEPLRTGDQEVEFQRQGEILLDSFQMIVTPTETQLEEYLDVVSSPDCTSVQDLDLYREDLGSRLRRLAIKSFDRANSKGFPQTMWNQSGQ
jgi:hypothetical protein